MELPRGNLLRWLSYPPENGIILYPNGFDLVKLIREIATLGQIILITDFLARYEEKKIRGLKIYDSTEIQIDDANLILVDSNYPDLERLRSLGKYSFIFLVSYGISNEMLLDIEKLFSPRKYGYFQIEKEADIRNMSAIKVKMTVEQEKKYLETMDDRYLNVFEGDSPKIERLLDLVEKGRNIIYSKYEDIYGTELLAQLIPDSIVLTENANPRVLRSFNNGRIRNLIISEVHDVVLDDVNNIIFLEPPSREVYQRMLFLCTNRDIFSISQVIKLFFLISTFRSGNEETKDEEQLNQNKGVRHSIIEAYNYLVENSSLIMRIKNEYIVEIRTSPERRERRP